MIGKAHTNCMDSIVTSHSSIVDMLPHVRLSIQVEDEARPAVFLGDSCNYEIKFMNF